MKTLVVIALILFPSLAAGHATIVHEKVTIAAGGTVQVAPANAQRLLLVVQASQPNVNCLAAEAYDDSAEGVVNLDTLPVLVQVPNSALALQCFNRDLDNPVEIDWTEIAEPAP